MIEGGLNPTDRAMLEALWKLTKGKAWEPPAPNSPNVVRLIETGFVKRCDMRCGFEAFKDAGLTWTAAGRAAMARKANHDKQ